MEPMMVVKKELQPQDKIIMCLEAADNNPACQLILCLVENNLERALFIFRQSVTNRNDVNIETILPMGPDFACEIEGGGAEGGRKTLPVLFRSGEATARVEFPHGDMTNAFVEQVMSSLEGAGRDRGADDAPSFNWLKPYEERLGRSSSGPDSFPDEATFQLPESDLQSADPRDSVQLRRPVPAFAAPITARETVVRLEMQRKEDTYTDVHDLRVFCGTWNVNGQSPTPQTAVSEWLAWTQEPPDIYAIGFQELDLSKEAFLFADTIKEAEWLTVVLNSLHPGASYRKVRLIRLVGIMLIVLVQDKHRAYVRNVAAEYVGTGIMGKMGNKGGVAVRLELHATSMCFVNSHLAAHVDEFERRNQDFSDICSRLRFSALVTPKSIKDHDQIFWLGDLNYRITELFASDVRDMIDKGAFHKVYEYDQLKLQRDAGRVYQGYEEGEIKFRPTYKYDPGTDNWDSSEKNRAPAWCDRVLWKGERIKQLHYTSHPSLRLSDHKPVTAMFLVGVKVIDPTRYRRVYEDIMKELDKSENDSLPQVSVDATEISFGTVHFLESVCRSLVIANTGQVVAQYRFINKLNDTSFCKPWLAIDPPAAVIMPGEKCEVTLEVRVDDRTAAKLNTCQDKLYDILVLHLENGKDIFITVQGDYVRSCFGASINALVHIKTPFGEVPVSRLLDLESASPKELSPNPYVIPKELWFLVDQLQRYGAGKDLFVQSGLPGEIRKIREVLDTTLPETLPGSVYSVAEALLLFLSSLPEPVIPTSFSLQCIESCDSPARLKHTLSQLPPHHKNVFMYICTFLKEVAERPDSSSGPDAATLAKIFGAVLIRGPSTAWRQRNNMRMEELDRRRAAVVLHFIFNEIDI